MQAYKGHPGCSVEKDGVQGANRPASPCWSGLRLSQGVQSRRVQILSRHPAGQQTEPAEFPGFQPEQAVGLPGTQDFCFASKAGWCFFRSWCPMLPSYKRPMLAACPQSLTVHPRTAEVGPAHQRLTTGIMIRRTHSDTGGTCRRGDVCWPSARERAGPEGQAWRQHPVGVRSAGHAVH